MTDKVSVSLTSMTLVYHYISFNFLGFITVLRNDGDASEDFGGNLEWPKTMRSSKSPVVLDG